MTTGNWESLGTVEQRTLLDNMHDDALAQRFGRVKAFFKHARAFFESLPHQTRAPAPKPHNPPKDLIISARRDLSFYEANYELFDNSIDEWRRRGAKKDLRITVEYDLELLTGKFKDDAGGMEEGDVFRVFIPGETTNRDYKQNVIGSFGMGAKKGIFRLTDGAKIVSCPAGEVSYTSEVPQKWEDDPDWKTLDGQAEAIQKGTTELFFFKLFKPPSTGEIDELRKRTGVIYAPLLSGKLGEMGTRPSKRVHIKINGVDALPPPDIHWSSPKGAEPKIYEFTHVFQDFLSTGNDIEIQFLFQCGLTRRLPGTAEDAEPDFGIDVYGNGRLIEPFLKDAFGFGTPGMAKTDQASKFVRGQLFINGHSFGIPWDTHKREYLADHPVALWLYDQLRPIIKRYKTIAGGFTSNTELRTKVLAISTPKEGKPAVHNLPVGEDVPEEILPKYEFKTGGKKQAGKGKEAGNGGDGGENSSRVKTAEGGNGSAEQVITATVSSAEYEDLLERFGADGLEELETAVRDCLFSGVAFTLTAEQLASALTLFKCDGDVGSLSDKVRGQLLKKLPN
jgi:hypothetical protein